MKRNLTKRPRAKEHAALSPASVSSESNTCNSSLHSSKAKLDDWTCIDDRELNFEQGPLDPKISTFSGGNEV